jgi:transposase
VHALDDIAALAERAQGRLGLVGDHPLSRSSLMREAERFQFTEPTNLVRQIVVRLLSGESKASQLVRTTLVARRKFVEHMLAIEITIRGLLKVHGLKLGALHRCQFAAKVEKILADAPDLQMAIEPLLEARNMMRKQKVALDRQLSQMARKDEVCRRLMTISGVGPIVSLSFKATIDDPKRFEDSKTVPAHLGLTPRVYQSGEIDRSGNISKCGDKMMRHALYEAANSHLRISKKWSVLRAWGVKLAKRIGAKKACVAVARKLAIIMHRMWMDGTDFRFGNPPATRAA